jgi:Zn-dependent peptidase ImmA (M78 family)
MANWDEIFANKFAAALLMPKEEVERLEHDGLSPALLALKFGVSEEAMNFRLDNLRHA